MKKITQKGNFPRERVSMHKGKILVVDDEVYILHILEFSLGAEGFEVISANNGELAVEKAKQEQPNLIILDIMMPVLDGYETCRRLKREAATKEAATKAKAEKADAKKAEAGGAEILDPPSGDIAD